MQSNNDIFYASLKPIGVGVVTSLFMVGISFGSPLV